MQIYLAKPGGPMQGPYTLEQVNADLAARHYRDDEFWAWHDGLTSWVPLYSIGGVSGAADTTLFFARPATESSKAVVEPPEPPGADTAIFLAKPPWINTLQQAVEARAPNIPVRPEQEDAVLTAVAPAPEESRPPGESQTAEAAASTAPLPAVEEPSRELDAPAVATGEPSVAAEPPTPLEADSAEHIVLAAPKAGRRSRNTAATRRSGTPKAPVLRGRPKSAKPITTPKRTTGKRTKSVPGAALMRRQFLTTELLATTTSREPTA